MRIYTESNYVSALMSTYDSCFPFSKIIIQPSLARQIRPHLFSDCLMYTPSFSIFKVSTMFVGIATFVLITLRIVSCQALGDEWYKLDDALYLVDNTTRLNYDDAQLRCQEYGGNLARVDSDEIQSFLTTFITPPFSSTRCFWIGCHDREVEDEFRWLDGTLVRYDGWSPGQPDDSGGNQDCACLWSSKNSNRHGQWDDNNCAARLNLICQKGVYNFQLTSERTNPGSAFVYCAVDIENDDATLLPGDVRLSVGKTLSSTRPISYSSTRLNGGFRNNSYVIENIDADDKIYCHIGELPVSGSTFSRIRFRPINFYALPTLMSSPTVRDISSTSVLVSWSSWIPCLDSGEGPVVGYHIYYQTMSGEWEEVGGIDLTEVVGDFQRMMEFELTGLKPGTEYNISVSAVREGPGGEGPRGPHVTFITNYLERERRTLREADRIWIIFGLSLLGNIILVIVIVIMCRKQSNENVPSLRGTPAGAVDPKTVHYDVPRAVGDGDDHVYEGLRRTESSNKESQYLSIDNSDNEHYINMNI